MTRHTTLRLCAFVIALMCSPSHVWSEGCSDGFAIRDLSALAKLSHNGAAHLNSSVSLPIAELMKSAAKSMACQEFINFYASALKLPSNIVKRSNVAVRNGVVVEFSNSIHPKLCGTIFYENHLRLPSNQDATGSAGTSKEVAAGSQIIAPSPKQTNGYIKIARMVIDSFVEADGRLSTEMSNVVQPYLPSGRGYPAPQMKYLSEIALSFQAEIVGNFERILREEGFDNAEADVFSATSGCAAVLPTASGPDEKLFANYPSAYSDYKKFASQIDAAMGQ